LTANAENIWRVPAFLPYLQPPLTDRAIADAERVIGYRLPHELLALLRRQNGGYIRFSLPRSVHDTIAGIGPHFPSLTAFDWEAVQEHVSFPLRGLVPFDGDGHWHLCLDYRTDSAKPSVSYVDVECDSQMQIASSFAEYLEMLTLEVGDDFVVDSVDEPTLIAQLSNALGVKFEPPDLWAYGYPVHRAALSNRHKQWLWISPNRVDRGFVRDNDPRYLELKDLLPGYGLRFPELPEQSLIVTTTDRVRQRVVDALSQCGITARPMRQLIAGD
jgi:hypothetical protein